MISSKSPWMVAMVALAAGKDAFSDYSHKYSPHRFTQPQLFACLVLKEFEKKDYRGIARLLAEWSALREALGLRFVPHFTTLQKASVRLLRLKHVRPLVQRTVRLIDRRRKTVSYAAGDSSGFEAHHASRYFIWRRDNQKEDEKRPKKRHRYKRFGKLMVIVNCRSHAILAAVASEGPTPDIDQLDEIVAELPASLNIQRMLLDAGFDSAHNHRLLREQMGILSFIPPEHGRPPKNPATLPKDAEGQVSTPDEDAFQPSGLSSARPGGDGLFDAQTQLRLGPACPNPARPPSRPAIARVDSQHRSRVN
jgi:hypothetical protein